MSDDKFRCRYCDKFRHVSEFEGFKTDDACMRCKAPKPTPDDKPKWRMAYYSPRAHHQATKQAIELADKVHELGLTHVQIEVVSEETFKLRVALVAAEKRIAELEAALTKRIQRDVIEFNETHKRPRYVDRITAERDEARAEVGQLRVQLAGCGVAAMQNTESTAKDRAKPGDYGYSASYGDVCRAVDREMALRAQAERLAEAIEVLLADSQHTDHKCADDRCPVDFARKALAEYRSDK